MLVGVGGEAWRVGVAPGRLTPSPFPGAKPVAGRCLSGRVAEEVVVVFVLASFSDE